MQKSRAGKWLAAGMSVICLVAGHAHATSVSGGQVVWSNAGSTYNAYGDFNISTPGDSPASYGAPLVTLANLGSWATAHPGDANMFTSVTPAMQTWRVASAASSLSGTENIASAQGAYASFQPVTVAAGTSGLNIGDPTTVQFTLHLDGTMALGNTAYPPGTIISLPGTYGYAAAATEKMRYLVYNPRVDNEVATLVFQHDAHASYGYSKEQYTDVLSDTFSSYGRYTSDRGHSWVDLAGNVNVDNTQSPVPSYVSPFASPGGSVRSVNTGYVTLSLAAQIGDILWIEGQLDTTASGWGDLRMHALSDFGSTFDAEVTSTTAGVQLLGLQAGVAAVPEPETYAMMLVGLGLVGWSVRRRKLVEG